MDDCDIRSPYWSCKGCPGKYDASHICRACQLQKVSEHRIEYPSRPGKDIVNQYASAIR
jgi:hypothetical protein